MRAKRFVSLAPFLFAALLFLARLGELPLVQPDEGRNAEIAREMKESGAWLIPSYNGVPYLDKPAFYFRAVALSLAFLGESEFSARLPSVLFALILLWVVFLFCKRFYGVRCASLAVGIIAASPLFLAFARIVIFDMALALFVTISILAGFLAGEVGGAGRRWSLLSSLAAALATLVKGPVGFLTPLLVLVVFALVEGNPRAILRIFSPLNVLFFAVLVVPWFLAVSHWYPDFPHYGIVEETLRRYATSSFRRTGPFYYYGPVLMAVFFPWSVLLPEAVGSIVRRWRALVRADRLLIVWATVVVLFFSTSQSKLPGYILAAIVALGILVARLFDRALSNSGGRAARLILRGTTALAILCLPLSLALVLALLDPVGVNQYLHIRAREFDRLRPAFGPVALSLSGIALVSLIARTRRSIPLSLAGMALLPVALLTICFGGLRDYAETGSARSLAHSVPRLSREAKIACVNSFPSGLPFYLGRTVILVSRDGRELESNYISYRLKREGEWPPTIVRFDGWREWLSSRDGPLFLMAGRKGRAEIEAVALESGLPLREMRPGWWGMLLPGPGGF
jgi:4-amino-4-deoxy-L-arabinose transferase-like glycosyltransferase